MILINTLKQKTLLFQDTMASYSLEMEPERYFTGYDTNVNPGIANSVATAALYFYISLVPKELSVYNEVCKNNLKQIRLDLNVINRTYFSTEIIPIVEACNVKKCTENYYHSASGVLITSQNVQYNRQYYMCSLFPLV